MPLPRRIVRLQQLILEVAAGTVQRDLADPRLGFVTLTRVRLSSDLAEAVIHWSCLGTDAERRKSARALSDATGLVQAVVAKAIGTRVTPTLTFRYDPTLERAGHLETLFEKIKQERPPEEPAPDASPAADEDAEEDADDDSASEDDATEDDAAPADDAADEGKPA
jgi:ribosome-binding factor A